MTDKALEQKICAAAFKILQDKGVRLDQALRTLRKFNIELRFEENEAPL